MRSLSGGLIFAWQDAFLYETPMARRSGEPDLSLARRRLITAAAAAICFPHGIATSRIFLPLRRDVSGNSVVGRPICSMLLEWFFRARMAALFPEIIFQLPLPTRLHSTAARLPDLPALGLFYAPAFVSFPREPSLIAGGGPPPLISIGSREASEEYNEPQETTE